MKTRNNTDDLAENITDSNKVLPGTLKSINKHNSDIAQSLNSIDDFVRIYNQDIEHAIHLHACRGGPALSNEIYLSINEKKNHPNLKQIFGLVHPFSPVLKYFIYWFGGLNKDLYCNAMENLIINNNKVIVNGDLNCQLLLNNASAVFINKKHALEILILLVLDLYGEKYLNILNLTKDKLIVELNSIFIEDIVSVEKFFIKISERLVNKILLKNNLPSFNFFSIEDSIPNQFINQGVNLIEWNKNYTSEVSKNKRIVNNIVNEFKKRFRGYNRVINIKDIDRIYDIFIKQKNRSTSKMIVNKNQLVKIIIDNDSSFLKNNYLNLSEIMISTYSKSIFNKKYNIPFISGKNMIELCFHKSQSLKTSLILQKFFRPGGYEKYQEMLVLYQNVQTFKSSVDIWDIQKFPEYDTNLFLGLNYL